MTKLKFVRQGVKKNLAKLREKWRRPRGIHNKLRRGFKGHGKVPSIGYKSNKSERYLHPSKLLPILVYNIKDLSKIDKEKEVCLISKGVGLKNKINILKKAEELNIKILNIRDIKSFLKEAEERINKKKEIREKKKKKKEEIKKEKKEKEEKTKEEKEKEEKLEKKKILESKKALQGGGSV